ncbi:MAG: hypothetical protein GY714_28935 [Desulfobacterales bacterium]|nr:hypothetical protein [Desulfobacterales bacterium]MCP4159314.1 hypothetical protein [Deltaproteobacteria bacterium]
MKFRIDYYLENWKMGFHLVFRTDHFGVNNDLWQKNKSLFGKSILKSILTFWTNYKMMKIRAFSGFIPLNDAIRLFPGYAKKHGYKTIK